MSLISETMKTKDLDLSQYIGRWVAISQDEIVAAAKTPEELTSKLEELKISLEEISLFLVPSDDETHHIL